MDDKFTDVATMHGYVLKVWEGVATSIDLPYGVRYVNDMHVEVYPHSNILNNEPYFTVVISANSSSLTANEMDVFFEVMEEAREAANYFQSVLNEG